MRIISENINYYSSDLNLESGSLIYSERSGNILLNGHTLVSDNLKKIVRFYFSDDYVFTSTDVTGLRVWDSYKGKVIYTYQNEELMEHEYSDMGIIAAASLYAINFYDLRSRYFIHSIPLSNVTQVKWIDSYLYAYSANKVIIYNYKLHEKVTEISDCSGFAIAEKNVFLLKQKHIMVFNSNDSENIYQTDIINKKTKYKKIMNVKGQNYILGITNENIMMESFDKVEKLNLSYKIKDVNALYVRGNKKILFMNDNIYEND